MIRQYALIKLNEEYLSDEVLASYPFKKDESYIFLGEIVQMPGHCIVVGMHDNKVYSGYHTDNFIEVPEDSH